MAEAKNRMVLSESGYKKLQEEHEYLTTIRRNEVAEQISIARGFGDLSENAEYDEAKNEQSRLEARIADIENTLRTAEVIADEDITTDKVNIGTTVTVKDMEDGEEETYKIVGATESDPLDMKISVECPIGKALIGAKKNAVVEVEVPDGTLKLKVLKIERNN